MATEMTTAESGAAPAASNEPDPAVSSEPVPAASNDSGPAGSSEPRTGNANEASKSQAKVPEQLNEAPIRWGYSYFATVQCVYHIWWLIEWIWWTNSEDLPNFDGEPIPSDFTIVVWINGVVSSAIALLWLQIGATNFCYCKPSRNPATTICTKDCGNRAKPIMLYPVAFACALRVVLYCAFMGYAVGHSNDSGTGDDDISEDAFISLFVWGAWDCGHLFLLTVDWWYYYGQQDLNGLLGAHSHPFRCVVSQSVQLAICSWAFVVWFAKYTQSAEYYVPWVLQGILSTLILVYCAAMEFQGIVEENRISKALYGYIATALAILLGIMMVCVCAFTIDVTVNHGVVYAVYDFEFFAFFLMYTASVVPTIIALASFKRQKGAVEWKGGADQGATGVSV